MNTEDPIDKLLGRAVLELPAVPPPPHFAEQVVRLHLAAHPKSARAGRFGLSIRWFALCLGLGFGSALAAFHAESEPQLSSDPRDDGAAKARPMVREVRVSPPPGSRLAPAEPERLTRAPETARLPDRPQAERKPAEKEGAVPERSPLLPRCDCGPAAIVCSCY